MTRFPVLPFSKYLFRVVTIAVTAASLPSFGWAQATEKQPKTNDKDAATTLEAEQMTGRPDREVILERNAEIIRGGTTVNADKATYSIVEDEVSAAGQVRVKRFGDRYTGDELKLKMDTGQGYVTHPTYKLELNNAQGKAERIDFESQDRASVIGGTYSTCEGPDPDWYLKSSTLNLDTGRDIGSASTAIVYFKGVPILGTPFMTFPLSDTRKSGILPPTLGVSNKGGLEILLPYYFNIAPNRDLTLYPKIISQRGFQLGAQGRYLGQTYAGETRVEGMLNDRLSGTKRYAISSTHTQRFSSGLTFSSNLNTASDDNYPNDFPSTITAASQRLLLRDINLGYGGSHWSATARASNYQVLQDPAAKIDLPYARLPQLTWQAARHNVNGFDWSVASDFTRFWHPANLADYPTFATPNVLYPQIGDRSFVNSAVSYPVTRPGYFITPKLSLDATVYSLSNTAPGAPSNLTRVLPTLSIDSGLVFERETSFLGKAATQTLEPRLFSVYTPYRDQSLFPNFDTAQADLSFTQMFSENRFTGHDRIGDANQVTAGLVSRYIEASGAERMRLAVAQRFHFTAPRVALSSANEVSRSDLLGSASGQISTTLSTEANMQYSQSIGKLVRTNYAVRWQPGPKRVLNLAYRRDVREELGVDGRIKQFEVSGQWPIASRWYAVGRINYSIFDNKIAESLLGMEYKADCWVFRMVGQRIPTATGVATSAFFFQLELNGLSKIGSNPLDALRASVPGYQVVNKP